MIEIKKFIKFPNELIDEAQIPIFCTPNYANYLKKVRSEEVFWFAGFQNDKMICLIPFSIIKKKIFRKGLFLTTVIFLSKVNETLEKEFLESVIAFIKCNKICDWIQQCPNWALFSVVPENSIYCEFGTYKTDLKNNNENQLFNKLPSDYRRIIRKAILENVIIKSGPELLEDCLRIFYSSADEGNPTLPKKNMIENLLSYLPENVQIYVAYLNDIPSSSVIFISNKFCLYPIYAARNRSASQGANHLLYWKAIIDAKLIGVKYFDFIGARIHPISGSKQEAIQYFKKHFGGEFIKGFLWKMPISSTKYYLYNFLSRFISILKLDKYRGDIIDQELKRKIN